MAGKTTKHNVCISKTRKRHTFVSPFQSRDVPASYTVKLEDTTKRESVKIIYLDATESLICSRALMIAQTSAVNMDAEYHGYYVV